MLKPVLAREASIVQPLKANTNVTWIEPPAIFAQSVLDFVVKASASQTF